ncbi:major facilitator superfamily domain-containing protein [Lentinula lateritia]|uniref:Major facilitator superfamily domain-containing protein n=1 Tax=Lentinula lateritia TaxID=40482 RepID=A0ABQ8UWH3_9AGAR|nr:major facilitator superfamily domain-containing protein [Lentinula lateritia]
MAEGNSKPEISFREYVSAHGLEEVHKRHGRIDLVPLPSDLPEDPLNWSSLRKNTLLTLVAFHACLGPFSAACATSQLLFVVPSFELFAVEFEVSLTKASYITAVPIVFLGTFPFLWAPISSRIGRRPVYLASMLISAAMQLASAYCTTFGALVTCRVLVAIFICPPQSIGASTVSEVFFVHEKGQKMGVWALMVSLGPTIAPLIMGPLVYHTGQWQWTFYLLAMMNFAHFILYLFFCPETLFDRPVLLTVQIPALLGQKYHLNTQQIGMQFIAPFLGALLGSDKWMQYRVKRADGKREVEWRLPFAIPGFFIAILGLMVLGVCLQNTQSGVWNITPDIGSAIALFGQQIVTTVCTTYAIESQPEHTGQAALLVALIRQTYAFTGPFYFTNQFDAMGIVRACGLLSGLIAIGMSFVLACMVFGKSWRETEARNEEEITHDRRS